MKSKEEVEALFEQVKHLIESDEPTEHPWEVHPHEFTESERAKLLEELPENADEEATSDFIHRIGLAIGTYHRLDRPNEEKLSNIDARKRLQALRNSVANAYERFVDLPDQVHIELDLALQHVHQAKRIEQGEKAAPYIRSFTEPYSDATKNWVAVLLAQLEELVNAIDLIEKRRQSNRGGKPVDRAMSYLSFQSAKAYRDCFGLNPTSTEGGPFEIILLTLAEVVGRNPNATDLNVMHYVQKAVKDLGKSQ